MRPIVLASTSPRRIDILTQAGVVFRVVAPGIDERPPAPLGPLRYVAWAAAAKADAVARRTPGAIVVAADTEVVRARRIFGKPGNRRQAAAFLRSLSGRRHQVYTAVHVIDRLNGFEGESDARPTFGRAKRRIKPVHTLYRARATGWSNRSAGPTTTSLGCRCAC